MLLNRSLTVFWGLYRLISSLAVAFSVINGGLVMYDGLVGDLKTYYRAVTFAIGLSFWGLGCMVAVLHHSLTHIQRHGMLSGRHRPPPELAKLWLRVYLVLTLAMSLLLVVLVAVMFGVSDRMERGITVFG